MSTDSEPPIPAALIPRQAQVSYDLNTALSAVVAVRAHVPEDAYTATILGTERAGHGVVISAQGLVLTIGYLITEAERLWLFDKTGRAVAGDVVAYDYETGFGLIQALGKLSVAPLELGSVHDLSVDDAVVVAGYGGRQQALRTRISAISEFAGYWEYLIDQALFTAPPHPNWGGAAVIDATGRLCAIGSLYIDRVSPEGASLKGNMCVPVDLFKPIMDELLTYGRTLKPARPWLGMFVSQVREALVVAGTFEHAPAAAALRSGDILRAVAGAPIFELAGLFRRIWACGEAGVDIPLTIERDRRILELRVRSVDRRDFWKKPSLH